MTAAAAPALETGPAAIDKLATEYNDVKPQLATAEELSKKLRSMLEEKADVIRKIVDSHGSAHASKSKIIHGLKFELLITEGQTLSVDAAAVEEFRLALVDAGKSAPLRMVFDKVVRWNLSARASEIIRGHALSNDLARLWANCQIVKSTTPRVQVRSKRAKEKSESGKESVYICQLRRLLGSVTASPRF
jgi:hypothetical protein